VNNGHTIQVNIPGAGTLTVGDDTFELAQYHFHAPSEHTIGGRHWPMEVHLVHKSPSGKLAVIGVLLEEGLPNPALEPLWSDLPKVEGAAHHFEKNVAAPAALLPADRTAYRYAGSLTTPPCSEDVRWFVMRRPVAISAAQLAAFTAIVEPNNRPVQPLAGRPVVTDILGESK
jgi:carbonic anhydrase